MKVKQVKNNYSETMANEINKNGFLSYEGLVHVFDLIKKNYADKADFDAFKAQVGDWDDEKIKTIVEAVVTNQGNIEKNTKAIENLKELVDTLLGEDPDISLDDISEILETIKKHLPKNMEEDDILWTEKAGKKYVDDTVKEVEEAVKDNFVNVEYDSTANKIYFYSKEKPSKENYAAYIDTTDFVKDGMISNVEVKDGNLEITFNEDSGQEVIKIPISDIFNAGNYYTKSEIDTNFYTKSETDTSFVKWGNHQGKKAIELAKGETIVSEGVEIAKVSDYDNLDFPVVELGGQAGAMVLNTNDQPIKIEITENGERVQHVVATIDDIDKAIENIQTEALGEDAIKAAFDEAKG